MYGKASQNKKIIDNTEARVGIHFLVERPLPQMYNQSFLKEPGIMHNL